MILQAELNAGIAVKSKGGWLVHKIMQQTPLINIPVVAFLLPLPERSLSINNEQQCAQKFDKLVRRCFIDGILINIQSIKSRI